MQVGSTYESTLWGLVEVTKYVNSREVHIKFLESGNSLVAQKDAVSKGLVRDAKRQADKRKEILKINFDKWESVKKEWENKKFLKSQLALEKENERLDKIKILELEKSERKRVRKYSSIRYMLTEEELNVRRKALAADSYIRNRDKVLEGAKQWQRDNPEKTRIRNSRRRGKRLNASGTHTIEETNLLLESQDGKCTACGYGLTSNKHLDHIMPLTLGGSNSIENLQWLCPYCNLSKNAKHPDDWAKEILTEDFKIRRKSVLLRD